MESAVAVAYACVESSVRAVIQHNVRFPITVHILRQDKIISRTPEQRLEKKIACAVACSEIADSGVLVVQRQVRFAIAGVVGEAKGCEAGSEEEWSEV